MTERRTTLLDGAIAVLGEQGVRAVTHRAVDAAAGLPSGSASNHFRSRDALFDAVVVRIFERERSEWERLARAAAPRTGEELADVLADMALRASGELRTVVLARYAILVEAGSRPQLRRQLLRTGADVNASFAAWVRTAGFDDLELAGNLIMNYWTGLVLHQLAMPDPTFDPRPRLRVLVAALLGNPSAGGIPGLLRPSQVGNGGQHGQ